MTLNIIWFTGALAFAGLLIWWASVIFRERGEDTTGGGILETFDEDEGESDEGDGGE